MKKNNIKVSILCIAYNQEDYIAQALDGIFMQKTNFEFEVIIHDDASTDKTQQIIKKYERKYLDKIRPVYEKHNQFSLNDKSFLRRMFMDAKGEYIAICEGDDFWTDPLKLQKQVDFLDKHKTYGLVFHPVRVFFENHEEEDTIYPEISDSKHFTLKNLLRNNYIQTNSVMYRRINYDNLPVDIMPLDWYLHLTHAKNGKIGFINEVMSAYRRHSGGIWWGQHSKPQLIWEKYGQRYLKLLHEIVLLHGDDAENRKIINSHIAGSYEAISSLESRDVASDIAVKSISEMPSETWDYIQHLMQQVEHYSKHDAYLQGVLESTEGSLKSEAHRYEQEIKQLSDELHTIKSSKIWRVMHLGGNATRHPARSVKRLMRYARSKVIRSKK